MSPIAPIFFIHLPKSGGSSIMSFFELNAGKDAYAHCDWDTHDQAKTVDKLGSSGVGGGHQPYGYHRISRTPLNYVTVLRDPLARQISHYWYARTGKNGEEFTSYSHAEAMVMAGKISLDTWVADSLDGGNLAVRMLSGMGKASKEALALAKENIDRRFLLAGQCEDISEFLLLLCGRTNLNLPFFSPTNITNVGNVERVSVSDAAAEKFKAENALDYELYGYVRDILDRDVALLGSAFKTALESVRQIQARVDILENPLRFKATGAGFDANHLSSVHSLVSGCDLRAINAFLQSARAVQRPRQHFYDGVVDEVNNDVIRGWAVNLGDPGRPVTVDVVSDGHIIESIVANQKREDVAKAGYGSNSAGFSLPLTPAIAACASFSVRYSGTTEFLRDGEGWRNGWHHA
ncbi:sulfotransferase family protein [Paraburkholderia tropica]|uniref:chondroitin 4-O-sulfotransferase n=1 Tax=Paraburkholderia tropica TaxID=92647 RepID=UPI002AB63177|nr:chondroitin 4-O-sulfotransferase [Paraburkholderia tropica]